MTLTGWRQLDILVAVSRTLTLELTLRKLGMGLLLAQPFSF